MHTDTCKTIPNISNLKRLEQAIYHSPLTSSLLLLDTSSFPHFSQTKRKFSSTMSDRERSGSVPGSRSSHRRSRTRTRTRTSSPPQSPVPWKPPSPTSPSPRISSRSADGGGDHNERPPSGGSTRQENGRTPLPAIKTGANKSPSNREEDESPTTSTSQGQQGKAGSSSMAMFRPPHSPSSSTNRPLVNLAPPTLPRVRSPPPLLTGEIESSLERRRSASPIFPLEREREGEREIERERKISGASRDDIGRRYSRSDIDNQRPQTVISGGPSQSTTTTIIGTSYPSQYYRPSPIPVNSIPQPHEGWSQRRDIDQSPGLRHLTSIPGRYAQSPVSPPLPSASSPRPSVLSSQTTHVDSSGLYNTRPAPFERSPRGWTSNVPPYIQPPSVFAASTSSSAVPTAHSNALPPGYEPMYYSGRSDPSGFAERNEDTEIGSMIGKDSGRERPPRSMMACVRCRKQKMKCDGPSAAPCRGCRSANVTCVFETKTRTSRPKSISYIGASQPLPAIMTTGGSGLAGPTFSHHARPSLDPYQLTAMSLTPSSIPQQPRPGPTMAPPPQSNISSSRVFYSAIDRPSPQSGISYSTHLGQPPPPTINQMSPFPSGPPVPPAPTAPTSRTVMVPVPVSSYEAAEQQAIVSHNARSQPFSAPTSVSSPDLEARLRVLENTVQTNQTSFQNAVTYLENQIRSLSGQLANLVPKSNQETRPPLSGNAEELVESSAGSSGSGGPPPVSDENLEAYHSYVVSLAPWLPVLNSSEGLSGEVINYLGNKVRAASTTARESTIHLGRRIRHSIGRLLSGSRAWVDEDLLALTVFAAWEDDEGMAKSVIGQARLRGSQEVVETGRMESARAWASLVVVEHM